MKRSFDVANVEISESGRAEEVSRTLLNISNAVSTTKDLKELYRSIHKILGEVIDLTNFYIAIYYKETDTIAFPYYVDEFDTRDESERLFSKDSSLTGSVIKAKEPLFLEKVELDKIEANQKIVGTTPVTWIGLPLIIKKEVIGVIATQSYKDPNCFNKIDRNILISVSDQIALAIERKGNEQELIFNEKKYRNIIETIEDSYYEVNLNSEFTLINHAACKILGASEEELISKSINQFMSRKTYHKVLLYIKEVLVENKAGYPIEIEVERKKRNPLYIETIISPIIDVNGKLNGFRGIARDVTQRIESEKIQRRLEEKLQQDQRLESLGTLAGGIAHDFNNLLMGIQGRLDLLKHDIEEDHPHLLQLKEIDDYIQSAASLTARLLGFARGGKYELQALDINTLITKNTQMFGRTRKEITLSLSLQKGLAPIEADSNQIDQVLLNLLVNSSQAMESGGGEITISTKSIYLDEKQAKYYDLVQGNYIQIILADTGKGIEKGIIANIFDPFFTTKPLGHGTGLGLAMVYGIVQNHGGAITVNSTVGRGTSFTLFFPVTEKLVSVQDTPEEVPTRGKETVLLVDDEDLITTVGRELLEVLNYIVFTASSGEEALTIYKENMNSIDLVIIDMIMPNMSGGVLFDYLKAINPDVKVLLSSGYAADGAAREILDRGCKGFIQKPYNLSAFSQKIRTILAC